jgi:membrane protein DedA with SNARE-associated domain
VTSVVHHLIHHFGIAVLAILFVVVALESSGLPVPGETALIAAGVLASDFQQIALTIAVAATAAIVGDNVGYWIGRTGGRGVLYHFRFTARQADRLLPRAERYFERYGGRTIFIARFVTGIRVTAAWIAGISRLRWGVFLFWNALGGICWATLVGLVAYFGGNAAAAAIGRYGLWSAAVLIPLALLGFLGHRWWRRRMDGEQGFDA